MNNYQCRKCSTHLNSASRPSSHNCPNGGLHSWTDLGQFGADNYQCKKCALLVQSKNRPSSHNCPTGGLHSWTKL